MRQNLLFFVVFLLITALCNIRKHTGTPKVLLKPTSGFFPLVICLEVKKKTEVETSDNKATNKNRVTVCYVVACISGRQNKPFLYGN